MNPTPDQPQTQQAQAPQASETATGPERTQEQQQEQQRGEAGRSAPRLRTFHAHIPIPYIDPRGMGAGTRGIASHLPPPRRLALYGGLGALAVVGALEWPVAAAIGAATAVLSRTNGDRHGTGDDTGRTERAGDTRRDSPTRETARTA